MTRRYPLIAEIAIDLVDFFEPAYGQSLEIELGCDAHIEIDPERVVKRFERTRRGATGDRLQHRGLDLNITVRVEEVSDPGDNAAARDENRARVLIRNEVQITLAVAHLHVGQPMPFFGKRLQGFGEKR